MHRISRIGFGFISVFVLSGFHLSAYGQVTSCTDALKQAEQHYAVGQFDASINLLGVCLEDEVTPVAQQGEAYRLMGLNYIAKDAQERAEEAVQNLIQLVPGYEPDPLGDPPVFVKMVEDIHRQRFTDDLENLTVTPEGAPVLVDLRAVFPEARGNQLRYLATSNNVAVVGAQVSGTTMELLPGAEPGQAEIKLVVLEEIKVVGSKVIRVTSTHEPAREKPSAEPPLLDVQLVRAGQPKVIDLDEMFKALYNDNLQYFVTSNNAAVAGALVDASRLVLTPGEEIGSTKVAVIAMMDQTVLGTKTLQVALVESDPKLVESDPKRTPVKETIEHTIILRMGGEEYAADLSNWFDAAEAMQFTVLSSVPEVVNAGINEGQLRLWTSQKTGPAKVMVQGHQPGAATLRKVLPVIVFPNIDRELDDFAMFKGEIYTRDLAAAPAVFQNFERDVAELKARSRRSALVSVDLIGTILLIKAKRVGKTYITLEGRDRSGGEIKERFQIQVKKNKDPIVLKPMEDLQLSVGETPVEIDLNTVFLDPELQPLVYAFGKGNQRLQLEGALLRVWPDVRPSEKRVSIKAEDSLGNSKTIKFKVITAL